MLRVAFALLFGSLTASLVQAQPMPEAAAQLAARISSLAERRTTVSLEFQNLTALPAAELSSFRTALEEELRKAGLEPAGAQSETRLRVTISENARGLLLVAVVNSGDHRQVAMLPWIAPPPAGTNQRVRISLQPVREQSETILDILLLDSGSQLLVLSPNKVSSYRLAAGAWTAAGIAAVSWARPLPRDPRGRLEYLANMLHIYVPGATCTGLLAPEFKAACAPGNEPWSDGHFVTDRNFLESDGVKGAFYTAAGGWRASSDGRILDRAGQPLAGSEDWGSEIAGIQNPCKTGELVLASKAGDAEEDQIRVYEIVDGQAAAVSQPAPLPGPVQALWPAETPGQVTLVIRNSKTGNYEASRLGVACAE